MQKKVGWDDEIKKTFKVRWQNSIEGMEKLRPTSVDRFALRKMEQKKCDYRGTLHCAAIYTPQRAWKYIATLW